MRSDPLGRTAPDPAGDARAGGARAARAALLLAALVVWGAGAGAARASEHYYRNGIPGGRAAGLAGAFTAIAADPTAAWYNPAGLAGLRHTSFSLSTSAYTARWTRIEDGERRGDGVTDASYRDIWVQPVASAVAKALFADDGDGDGDGTGEAADGPSDRPPSGLSPSDLPPSDLPPSDLPLMTGGFFVFQLDAERADRLVLLDRSAFGGGAVAVDRFSALQREQTNTTAFGLSFGVEPWRGWSFGAALVAYYHAVQASTILDFDRALPGGAAGFDTRVSRVKYGVVSSALRVGVLTGPWWGGFSAGLVVQTPNLHLYSFGETHVEDVRWGAGVPGGQEVTVGGEDDLTARHRLPLEVALGLAWVQPRSWGVSLDVVYDLGVGAHDRVDSDLFAAGLRTKKAPVVDAAVGAELYVHDAVALRGGFFTQRDNTAVYDEGAFNASRPGDRLGGTFAIAVHTGRVVLDLGVIYHRAAGTIVVVDEAGEREVGRSEDRLSVFAAVAYHLD